MPAYPTGTRAPADYPHNFQTKMKTLTTERSPLGSGTCSPFLTVTGADERTDVTALAKLDAEIGLLYTETPEGRNRYPRWEWIRETSLELRRTSLHVCGRGARAKLMEGKLSVSGFQRIQVNGGILALEVEHLCEMYPRHTIITQHHTYNAHLLAVRSINHAILIDASGGRGILPSGWSQPATEKAVGFAGGLGPDNLADELQTIGRIARPGWWVDMEGKLRVDDWFSLELAGEVVAQFSSVNDLDQARAAQRVDPAAD